MSRIKLDFNKPASEQVSKTREVITKMTGNLNYLTPSPALVDVGKAADDLETAIILSANNDKAMKALMRVKRKELKSTIVSLGDYIQKESGGDETKIISSGFDVRKTPTPVGLPLAPVKLKVLAATHLGELNLTWNAAKGVKSYVVEMTTDPLDEINFSQIGLCTKAGFKVTGLASGVKYWFRVKAVNAAGESGWSIPAFGRTM